MTESNTSTNSIRTKAADTITVRVFVGTFVAMMLGWVDGLINILFNHLATRDLDWVSNVIFDLVGPQNLAGAMRADEFWGFTVFSAICAFVLAIVIGALVCGIDNLIHSTVLED